MKIRLVKSHLRYKIGTELDVSNTAGKYLIDQQIAESMSNEEEPTTKSLDSPPKDKMIRDTSTKQNRKTFKKG